MSSVILNDDKIDNLCLSLFMLVLNLNTIFYTKVLVLCEIYIVIYLLNRHVLQGLMSH